jgi:hypothetical protein
MLIVLFPARGLVSRKGAEAQFPYIVFKGAKRDREAGKGRIVE